MIDQIETTELLDSALTTEILQNAHRLEEAGKYEEAVASLKPVWKGLGFRPSLEGLEPQAAAETLLITGTLTGWIGYARKISGAQDEAINLISESIKIFESTGDREKKAEAQIGIAICLWREGNLEGARHYLKTAQYSLGDIESDQAVRIVLNLSVVENTAGRLHDSLKVLTENRHLAEKCSRHTLRGRYHTQFGNVLQYLGTAENREDYIARSFEEFSLACHHHESGGNMRAYIQVINNLANLSLALGKKQEAHELLDRVQDIAEQLHDHSLTAMLDETRAQILLAENRVSEAEGYLQPVIDKLEKGGDNVRLAEALITYGSLLARTGRYDQARFTLEQATDAADRAGSPETAGQAQLTILEEMPDRLQMDEMAIIYERADLYLTETQNPKTLARLRACARQIIYRRPHFADDFKTPKFIFRSSESATLLKRASRLGKTKGPILITGEPGAGKETLARVIHEWSRLSGDFDVIDCASITPGRFELALSGFERGTLMLDEIGDLSPENQMTLLRQLKFKGFDDLSQITKTRVPFRIIATTSRNIPDMIVQGFFRADLYYRLETYRLDIPPLRSRPDDIPALVEHFLKETTSRHNKSVQFTPQAIELLKRLPFRGNARELRTLIERTVSAAKDGTSIQPNAVETLALRQIPANDLIEPWANCSIEQELLKYEGELIELALKSTGGQISHAAALLGLKHQTLGRIIESRQRHLLSARTPRRPRRQKNAEAQEQ